MEIVLDAVWKQAIETFPELERQIPKAIEKATLQEANDLRKRIVAQFREQRPAAGSWAALSDLTIRARKVAGFGGTKILIRSSDLRNSIKVTPISNGVIFVGVHRTAGTSKGGNLAIVNLGYIHEFGATVKVVVTRKMQRFLFGVLLKTKKGRNLRGRFSKGKGGGGGGSGRFKVGATLTIKIPARPFIAPAVEAKSESEYERSIAERFAKLMAGKLGKP